MGAYAIIRRCIYVGECEDYKGRDLSFSIHKQFSARLKKFSPEAFDKKFISLAKYQYEWPLSFFESFKREKKWAADFSGYFYRCGQKGIAIEKSISNYGPLADEGKRILKEAALYIKGRKYGFFRNLYCCQLHA